MPNVDLTQLVTAEDRQAAQVASARAAMRAYRLAFEDACQATAHGEGTLLDALLSLLDAQPPAQRRRYDNITIFERLRPEITGFLQVPGAIDLTDESIDDLFRLAMSIERGAT